MTDAGAPGNRLRKLVKKLGKRLFHGTLLNFLSRQSQIPDEPILDASLFPWAEEIRKSWPLMRKELDEQLQHRAELPSFQEISPDQYRISPDDGWKTFLFVGFGETCELNRELCPETARVLDEIPALQLAFFSMLAPGKHIPTHRGVTKGLVRCHLALKVPQEAEKCRMRVGDRHFCWREGEMVFLDDTYPHEVWNDTDEERAVLLFDFERPMTRRGRFVSHLMLKVMKRTAFFKDAQRNQAAWEEQYRKVLERQAA